MNKQENKSYYIDDISLLELRKYRILCVCNLFFNNVIIDL